jgi:hypothetical protein
MIATTSFLSASTLLPENQLVRAGNLAAFTCSNEARGKLFPRLTLSGHHLLAMVR